MRAGLAPFWSFALGGFALLAASACKGRRPPPAPPRASSLPSALLAPLPAPRPISSEAVAFEKALQQSELPLPARRVHAPQLAFGKGVLGQLTRDALRVFDSTDFRLLATEPLEAPRAVVALADGSLLALDARRMLRWEPGQKRAKSLARPLLLPAAQVYPDARQPDVVWVFDDSERAGAGKETAVLRSYRLESADEHPVALPELTIQLTSPGGVFGTTREGVWLYWTAGHADRFAPNGLRLPGLQLPAAPPPTWLLPHRRLDQCLWVEASGRASRVLVSPTYKGLGGVKLGGRVLSVDVGDGGRLFAAVVITGAGPKLELELRDQELAPLGRVALPGDEPTGTDDWVKVVTENQTLACSPSEPRVAVGGPTRLLIFDARGQRIFSIPSM
jgi:hypothetical protein